MEINRQFSSSMSAKLRKAYLISLCLCAEKTLAVTTTAEEAVQEKAFIAQVLESLTKPSSEHMATYIGLGLALAIVAGIVFIAMGNSAGDKQGQIKVTLDDVKTDSKKPTAKVDSAAPKKKEDANAKESEKKTTTEDGEEEGSWSDEDSDEIDTDNLYKDLDQKGPFLRTVTGTLEPESLLKLRRIIIRYAAKAFMERKEELQTERINHLKRKKYSLYKECLQNIGAEFQEVMFKTTKTAAEFLELDPATYEASVRELMSNAEHEDQFYRDEEQERLAVDTEGHELLTR